MTGVPDLLFWGALVPKLVPDLPETVRPNGGATPSASRVVIIPKGFATLRAAHSLTCLSGARLTRVRRSRLLADTIAQRIGNMKALRRRAAVAPFLISVNPTYGAGLGRPATPGAEAQDAGHPRSRSTAAAAEEGREESKPLEQEGDHRSGIFSGSERTDQRRARRPRFGRRTGQPPRVLMSGSSLFENRLGFAHRMASW
jgi:hypothetical protein